MLAISGKEYNLEILFQYEALKEVLMALAKNNLEMKGDIDSLQNNNKEKDKKIEELENQIKSMNEYNEQKFNNIEINFNNFKNILSNFLNQNDNKLLEIEKLKQNEKDVNLIDNFNQDKLITQNTLTELEKKIKDNQIKIEELEKNIKDSTDQTEMNDLENSIEKKFKEYNMKNENMIKNLQSNINELNEKNETNEKKIEDCLLKCSNLNVLEEIKDSGNGDIDATKLLIKSLETKVFTKFNTIEERFKNIQIEFMKVKNLTESHNNSLEELKLNLQLLKDDFEKLKNTFNNTTNKLNKKDNSLENKIKEILENTPNNNNSLIDEKIKLLEDEFSKIKTNLNSNINTNSNSNKLPQKQINSGEDISKLEDKINEIQKKIIELDGLVKNNIIEKEIENLKKSLKDLQYELQNKLTQQDLKELYDNHLMNLNEINSIKDQINSITKNNKKQFSEINQKLEKSPNQNNINETNNNNSKSNSPNQNQQESKNYEKYISITKNLYQEIDKLKKQNECIQHDIDEIYSLLKNIPTNDDIKDLENRILKIIDEFKQVSLRKFSDKHETNRTIKTIEIKIKQLSEEKRIENNESWLIANRPLNNFKCASCEAIITNLNPPKEYLPWNKLPLREDKQYRIGAGFSHKLNMLNQDYINSKDISSDNELRNQRSFSGIKINNQNNKKVKLPKVDSKTKIFSLNENIPPVSDEENSNFDEKKDNNITPKIMRIYKHRKNGSAGNNEDNYSVNSQNLIVSNDGNGIINNGKFSNEKVE